MVQTAQAIQFVTYDTTTGQISSTSICPEEFLPLQVTAGQGIITGVAADDTSKYVVADVITDKPSMPLVIPAGDAVADDLTEFVITGVPTDCAVTVDGEALPLVTDGSLELTFDLAGEYKVIFIKFPYLDDEVTINAA